MRKASTLAILGGGIAGSIMVLGAPAFAADYVDEAVSGLSSSNVYVDPQASLSNLDKIKSGLDGSSAAVVVLPDLATQTNNPTQLASQILNKTSNEYDTVVVAIAGSNAQYGVVSSSGGSEEISTAIYSNNTGSAGDAILSSLDTIKTATGTSTSTSSDGGIGGAIVGVGGGMLGLALIGAVGFTALKRWKSHKAASVGTSITYDELPHDLRKVLNEFRSILLAHKAAGNQEFIPKLESVLSNIQQLFQRIDKRKDEQKKRMASVSYIDTFTKLNQALGEDYYLDIMAHPELWDNTSSRMDEVRDALYATHDQIIQNIREVNASQDLNFKVALESLTRSMDKTTVNDLYSPKPDSKETN